MQLDEILRLLFDVSKPTLVNMLNGLFNENLDPEQVEISKDNAKFVNSQLEVIEGDLFFRITNREHTKPHHMHLEMQTYADGGMGIRVLQYSMAKAVESSRLTGRPSDGTVVLYMPKSIVIHIEENKSIPEQYKVEIVFADGESKLYTVPVVKYWTYSNSELIEKKLYPLLPLRVFLLRSKLDRLTKDGGDKEAKKAAILEAKDAARKAAEEAASLYESNQFDAEDLDKVLTATGQLFVHLNNRYEVEEALNMEVNEMIKTLGLPEIFTKAKVEEKRETAKRMLLKNKPIEEIREFTGLSEKEIIEIRESMNAKS